MQMIEELFLVRRFGDVIEQCEKVLSQLEKQMNLNETELQFTNSSFSHEQSIPWMSLLIQSLYELGRENEILPRVLKFYGSQDKIPFDIAFMCAKVKVTQKDYVQAEELVKSLLNRITADSNNGTLIAQREYMLIELLVIGIYVPTKRVDVAIDFVKNHKKLTSSQSQELIERILEKEKQGKTTNENENEQNGILSGNLKSNKSKDKKKKVTWDTNVIDPTQKKNRRSNGVNKMVETHNNNGTLEKIVSMFKHSQLAMRLKNSAGILAVITFISILIYWRRNSLFQLIKKKIINPVLKLIQTTDSPNQLDKFNVQRRR